MPDRSSRASHAVRGETGRCWSALYAPFVGSFVKIPKTISASWPSAAERLGSSAAAALARNTTRSPPVSSPATAGRCSRGLDGGFSATAHRTLGHHQRGRSEEHTSELQSLTNLVCRLLLE